MRVYHPVAPGREEGLALVVSLLFLLVVTIISIVAANNSVLSLKMSANMQDSYRSFQSAEAGIYATLGLVGSAADPFRRQAVVREPFAGVSPHPLRDMLTDPNDPASSTVDTDVLLIAVDGTCPRPDRERGGSSEEDTWVCDYYRIRSEYDVPGRARARVEMGVVKAVAGE